MRKGVTIFACCLLAGCSGPYELKPAEKMTADNGALLFFQNLGGKFTSCSPSDSDKDGYVTCEGADKDGKPAFATVRLQGSAVWL